MIPHPGVPSSYFEVEIERILLDDGRLEEGSTFELRLYGTAPDPNGRPWPMPGSGQRLLFALGVNPDFQSYGAGPWNQIDIDGSRPVYRDWAGTPVAFAECMDPEAFLAELEAVISATD